MMSTRRAAEAGSAPVAVCVMRARPDSWASSKACRKAEAATVEGMGEPHCKCSQVPFPAPASCGHSAARREP